jgi:acyl carrier protein
MLTETETRQTLFSILADIAPEVESESDIDLSANLRKQVDLDSMDFLNFITAVSEQFKIEIPEKDYGKLTSFNDFVKYIASTKSN